MPDQPQLVSVLRNQAVRQAERAVHEARLAVASKLVALRRSELDRYPGTSLAYARRSLETPDNPQARCLAVEALWPSSGPSQIMKGRAVS